MVKLKFWHNSQWIIFPTQSCLVLYSLALIYCICLYYDWSFRLYYHITYIHYFVVSCLFILWHSWSLWGCNKKRFSFSLKVSLSLPSLALLAYLSLKISIQLFLFSSYCYSFGPCVVCIVSGRCKRCFMALFLCSLGDVLSRCQCYFNVGESFSSFSWHI